MLQFASSCRMRLLAKIVKHVSSGILEFLISFPMDYRDFLVKSKVITSLF